MEHGVIPLKAHETCRELITPNQGTKSKTGAEAAQKSFGKYSLHFIP